MSLLQLEKYQFNTFINKYSNFMKTHIDNSTKFITQLQNRLGYNQTTNYNEKKSYSIYFLH